MGAIDDFPGWDFEPSPYFNGDLRNVDDLIPEAPWFWGGLQNYCVVRCCGIGAFDFRSDYVSWAMGVSDQEPEDIPGLTKYRQQQDNDVVSLAEGLRASADSLDMLDDQVVATHRLGADIRPTELANLFRHLATALTPT